MRFQILSIAVVGLLLSGCAASGTAPAHTQAQPSPSSQTLAKAQSSAGSYGEIIYAEPRARADMAGANAAISIGAAVVGALIPGGWGGVASTAAGSLGRVAASGAASQTRYHVRTGDGAIEVFTQPTDPALSKGAAVNIIALADGTKRLAAAARP